MAACLPFVRTFQDKVPPLHVLVPCNQKEKRRGFFTPARHRLAHAITDPAFRAWLEETVEEYQTTIQIVPVNGWK